MTDPLDALRRQAKILHKSYETGDRDATVRVDLVTPRSGALKRADFLHVAAREENFASWPQIKIAVETQGIDRATKQKRLKIALFNGQSHVVQQLMWDTPDFAQDAFGLQVALYDLDAVRKTLADDPHAATRTYGPRRPILHLAFSKMLADLLKPVPLPREEELLALAAQNSLPENTFIDPAKVPPVYADIVRQMVHPDQDLTHLKALIALGMPWDKPDSAGLPPVQIAGWEGLLNVVAYFLNLKPDLSHVNGYGGTLLSTIIHGPENDPNRAGCDYLACLRLVQEEGVALPKRTVGLAGDPNVVAFLGDWAARHPGQVVAHGVV